MKRPQKRTKIYTHAQIVDKLIGKRGTPEREKYEIDIRTWQIGDSIRDLRKKRKLTQEQLGKLAGVQKTQISELENSPGNINMETIFRVFSALKVDVKIEVQSEK
ncbi:MAG TPA: helix-turn-helix domain-containing protein [Bacteroidia bacterium]|nr:helix-turn-helix domain-containing protein [Bacteroidia bacterium]